MNADTPLILIASASAYERHRLGLALKKTGWANPVLVHTGQHYDHNMSDAILNDLRVPAPDFHLGVGSGSHAEQTGGVMIAYEKICLENRPDWIVVVGDVTNR